MAVTVNKLGENLYELLEGFVRCFLMVGTEHALLLDTGAETLDLQAVVREITPLPIKVYLTHADGDHIAASNYFDEIHINMEDAPLFAQKLGDYIVKLVPITEGERIDIGGYTFETVFLPGHTRGAVAYLCLENGFLFVGDSVQEGPLFLFGAHRNVDNFITSTRKLLAIKDRITAVYPCHHTCPLGADYIDYTLRDVLALKAGELEALPCDRPDLPCQLFHGERVSFYY